MTIAYISLGSNMGDKVRYIQEALVRINASPGVRVDRVASLYETAPWGYTEQDWFVNTAAEITCQLEPQNFLAVLLDIEKSLDRTREVHWGPRTIDLDLLLFGQTKLDLPELQLPHPRLTERAFVLVPLAELCPDLVLDQGSIQELAWSRSKEQPIRKIHTVI